MKTAGGLGVIDTLQEILSVGATYYGNAAVWGVTNDGFRTGLPAQSSLRSDGNVELALAGYNGGPNRIRRLWQEAGPAPELDSFVETLGLDESRDYVKRILVLAEGRIVGRIWNAEA